MSLVAVVEGIDERLQTLNGSPHNLVVLDYEPAAIQVSPIALVLFSGFDGRNTAGQITTTPWEITVRLMVKWQDNEGAEAQLRRLVDAALYALDTGAKLGGRIDSGLAQMPRASAGFTKFGGTDYRLADITVRAVDKPASVVAP